MLKKKKKKEFIDRLNVAFFQGREGIKPLSFYIELICMSLDKNHLHCY